MYQTITIAQKRKMGRGREGGSGVTLKQGQQDKWLLVITYMGAWCSFNIYMLPRTTDICTCTWKQGVWWSCGEQRYVCARTCADSRYVCEVCGEQKCCLTESPGEVVVGWAVGREIMDSTKSHKRGYWLSGPFAFLQEEHTHFALLLSFGRPVLTDTPKENNCALCQTPLSGICCLIWYGDFYFF